MRDAAIVAFADRRTGVGLYAFVEADQAALETQLRSELAAAKGVKPPEHIQVVHALPRDAAGKPRTEILQLVAMNQIDLIEPMMKSDADRAFLKDILEQRKNLRDRFNFEVAEMDRQRSRRRTNCRHPRKRVPSIPETSVIQWKGRSVLLRPVKLGDETVCVAAPTRQTPPCAMRATASTGSESATPHAARKDRYRRATSASDRAAPPPAAGKPAAPAAARCKQRQCRLQMAARFADQLLIAARSSASACRKTLPPCRCRGSPAIAAERTTGAATASQRQRCDHLRDPLSEAGVARQMIDLLRRRRRMRAQSENSADEVSLM